MTSNLHKISLPWNTFYSEPLIYKSALDLSVRSLYMRQKALRVSHDGQNLYDFMTKHRRVTADLHADLASRRFQFEPAQYKKVQFYNKERDLYVETWRDKLVDLAIFKRLNQLYAPQLSESVFSYRPDGFGLDVCQHAVSRYVSRHPNCFVLKRDISKYFPSIDHDTLLGMLEELVADKYLLGLLKQRIKAECVGDGPFTLQRGVLFGTPLACFFANLYLNPLDRALDANNVFYARYADDILVLTDDRVKAEKCISDLDRVTGDLKLSFKPSHIINGHFGAEAGFGDIATFKFLGVIFDKEGHRHLTREKGRKIRNLFSRAFGRIGGKLKRRNLDSRVKLLVETANSVTASGGVKPIAIIDYYLKHIDDEAPFEHIDRWLAEEIASLATGNGHKKSNFRKVPFSKLREMGLLSLVHRKRLINHGHIESSFFTHRNAYVAERARRFTR